MARRISDLVPAIVGGCLVVLALLFHSIYEDLLKAAVFKRLSGFMGVQEAELVSRLTEMALPILGSVAVVWFLYGYLKRELSAQTPDAAIEAQQQHTAAIQAQTEVIRAAVWPSAPSADPNRESDSVLEEDEKPLPIPINEASLGAYIWSSQLVKRLDRQIAGIGELEIEQGQPETFPVVEQALLLGVMDLAELDRLLDAYQEEAVKLANYCRPGKVVAKGECVWHLFDFLAAQLGREKFQEFTRLLQHSRSPAAAILTGFEQITKYSPKGLKRVTWWKPAADFNLIPLMKAAALAQTELENTPNAKRRAQNVPPDDLALSYCYTFMNKITFYGRQIQYDKRVTPSEYRRPIPNRHGKLVFDGEMAKLIPHARPADGSNMQRPSWDRLCVLRPDVLDVIGDLKKTP
jgi:hypothetical protein